RVVPWVIKRPVIDMISKRASRAITALLTNLGPIELPQSMGPYVDMIEVVPYCKNAASISCGISSVGGKMNITFTSNIAETDVIMRFFDIVSEHTGLDIEVYSNGAQAETGVTG